MHGWKKVVVSAGGTGGTLAGGSGAGPDEKAENCVASVRV